MLQQGEPGAVLLPIHWGTFNLAFHPWAEPGEWTKAAADGVGQAFALPVPGQPFEPDGVLPVETWWRGVGYVPDHEWPVPEIAVKTSREDLDLVGELRRVTNVLVAMSEAKRNQALRAIDGPLRRHRQEQTLGYRPLPSLARSVRDAAAWC